MTIFAAKVEFGVHIISTPMKKVLEVLQYGECDFRFNTDLDPEKHPEMLTALPVFLCHAMMTSLWGGNETAVIAMIRCLAIADLAACANRKEMIRQIDEASAAVVRILKDARQDFEKAGGRISIYGPGVKPPKVKS